MNVRKQVDLQRYVYGTGRADSGGTAADETAPEALTEAMTVGWTQNVVILEADLTFQEKYWYIQAVSLAG